MGPFDRKPGLAGSLSGLSQAPARHVRRSALVASTPGRCVKQAFVVGNNVISFDTGVTAGRRLAAVNCTLLAQLVADKAYPDRSAAGYIANWMASYSNTLLNIGWIKQTGSNGSQNLVGSSATVEAAIFTIAGAFVGAGGAALVKTVLDGLAKLGSGNAAFVLFQRQSQSAKVADFTAGLGSSDATGDFMLDLMEYDVEANVIDGQTLFFKWSNTNAILNYQSMSLTLSDAVYNAVATDINQKLSGFAPAFVKLLQI
jgi:hypothetical protein